MMKMSLQTTRRMDQKASFLWEPAVALPASRRVAGDRKRRHLRENVSGGGFCRSACFPFPQARLLHDPAEDFVFGPQPPCSWPIVVASRRTASGTSADLRAASGARQRRCWRVALQSSTEQELKGRGWDPSPPTGLRWQAILEPRESEEGPLASCFLDPSGAILMTCSFRLFPMWMMFWVEAAIWRLPRGPNVYQDLHP